MELNNYLAVYYLISAKNSRLKIEKVKEKKIFGYYANMDEVRRYFDNVEFKWLSGMNETRSNKTGFYFDNPMQIPDYFKEKSR